MLPEQWSPTAFALVVTTIGVAIEKIITSYFTGRKLAMIEAHVNSQKTADSAKIQALENEARFLREQASENAKIAAILAQAKTFTQVPIRMEEPKILEEMKEIKDNTANTVDAVKDLKKGK